MDSIYKSKKYNNVREIIKDICKRKPSNIAFTIKEKNDSEITYKNISYKEFESDINALGTGLINLGLGNKRIAIIGNNRYEWILSYISIICGVGIAVPLDKGLPEQEIEDSLVKSKADAIIFESKYSEIIENIKKRRRIKVSQFICMDSDKEYTSVQSIIEKGNKLIDRNDRKYLDTEIDNDKMSVLVFTSGTTSLAKAVMLSHRNIASNVYALNTVELILSTDTNFCLLPFHHTFGSTGILFILSNGARNVFTDGLRHIPDNLKEYKVSVFIGVPLLIEAMHKKIWAQIEKKGMTKKVNLAIKMCKFLLKLKIDVRRTVFKEIHESLGGHLRFLVSGAAGLDKKVEDDFNAFGIETVQGYGLTETSPVLCAENIRDHRYGSIGVPMCNVEMKIDQPDKDGIGEVIAKGPNLMLGYYEDKEATDEVIIDGWFHTGDMGYQDKDGFFYITGRKKNVIVLKNGKNIFPEELELLVSKLPYVKENMVFGWPDKDNDLVVSAKIVYDEEYFKGKKKEEIEKTIWQDIKQIDATLPKDKHIKKIVVTDEEMIKTTTAKVKRFKEIEKTIKENS